MEEGGDGRSLPSIVFFTGCLSVPRWKELELEDKQYEIEKELSELFCVTGI